jgi:hypothetical protein
MLTQKIVSNADSAWKDVLDVFLKDFIDFCFPQLSTLIDWSRGWEFLDKELQAITKNELTGTRLVDKLVKVFLKNGQEQWVLIHCEVQGKRDEQFPKRMFVYSYRLYDKFQRPIISCAILTDESKSWRPCSFEIGMAGARLNIDYLVIKLIDYQGQEAQLETETNPFASVILVQLAALKAKKQPDEERSQVKFVLTKRLYEKGFNKIQVQNLYRFIDWLIALPKPLELDYLEKIYALEEVKKMSYISTAEQLGMEKGMIRGESIMLQMLLKRKFGEIQASYRDRIEHADADTLLTWGERLIDAKKVEDIFEK